MEGRITKEQSRRDAIFNPIFKGDYLEMFNQFATTVFKKKPEQDCKKGLLSEQVFKDMNRRTICVFDNEPEFKTYIQRLSNLDGESFTQGYLETRSDEYPITEVIFSQTLARHDDNWPDMTPILNDKLEGRARTQCFSYLRKDELMGGLSISYDPWSDKLFCSVMFIPENSTSYLDAKVKFFLPENLALECLNDRALDDSTSMTNMNFLDHLRISVNNNFIFEIAQKILSNKMLFKIDPLGDKYLIGIQTNRVTPIQIPESDKVCEVITLKYSKMNQLITNKLDVINFEDDLKEIKQILQQLIRLNLLSTIDPSFAERERYLNHLMEKLQSGELLDEIKTRTLNSDLRTHEGLFEQQDLKSFYQQMLKRLSNIELIELHKRSFDQDKAKLPDKIQIIDDLDVSPELKNKLYNMVFFDEVIIIRKSSEVILESSNSIDYKIELLRSILDNTVPMIDERASTLKTDLVSFLGHCIDELKKSYVYGLPIKYEEITGSLKDAFTVFHDNNLDLEAKKISLINIQTIYDNDNENSSNMHNEDYHQFNLVWEHLFNEVAEKLKQQSTELGTLYKSLDFKLKTLLVNIPAEGEIGIIFRAFYNGIDPYKKDFMPICTYLQSNAKLFENGDFNEQYQDILGDVNKIEELLRREELDNRYQMQIDYLRAANANVESAQLEDLKRLYAEYFHRFDDDVTAVFDEDRKSTLDIELQSLKNNITSLKNNITLRNFIEEAQDIYARHWPMMSAMNALCDKYIDLNKSLSTQFKEIVKNYELLDNVRTKIYQTLCSNDFVESENSLLTLMGLLNDISQVLSDVNSSLTVFSNINQLKEKYIDIVNTAIEEAESSSSTEVKNHTPTMK